MPRGARRGRVHPRPLTRGRMVRRGLVGTVVAPPAAPDAPTLSGKARSVTVTWSAASGADSYTVQRSPAGAGTWSDVVTGFTYLYFVDGTVSASTAYDYRVVAVNGGGSTTGTSASTTTLAASATSYAALLKERHLELYLRLNENGSTTATDEGDYGRDGTYAGSYTQQQAGMLSGETANKAAQFTSASAGNVAVPHAEPLNLGTDPSDRWTLLFGLNVNVATGGTFPPILGKGAENTDGFLLFHHATNDELHYKSTAAIDTTMGAGASGWNPEATQHSYAISYDGDSFRIYKNGTQIGFAASVPGANKHKVTSTAAFVLNRNGTGSAYGQDNTLDEVAVVRYAMSDAEIAALQTARSVGAAQTVAVGQASAGSTAQQLGRGKGVGQATAVGTAQSVTARKAVTVGQASAVGSAQAVTARKVKAAGQASGSSTANAVTARKAVTVGQASSISAGQAVTSRKTKVTAVGQASSASTAQPLGRVKTVTGIGPGNLLDHDIATFESEILRDPFDPHNNTGGVTLARSTTRSTEGSYSGELTVTAEGESDGGFDIVLRRAPVTPGRVYSAEVQVWRETTDYIAVALGWRKADGSETGSLTGLSGAPEAGQWNHQTKSYSVEDSATARAPADAAYAVLHFYSTYNFGVTAGQKVWIDQLGIYETPVLPATWQAPPAPGIAQPVTVRKTAGIGQATAASTAQLVGKAKGLGQAESAATAQAVTSRKTATLGQAVSSSQAGQLTSRKTAVVGQAASSSVANTVTARKTVTVGQAADTSTAQVVTPVLTGGEQTIAVGQAGSRNLLPLDTADGNSTDGLRQTLFVSYGPMTTDLTGGIDGRALRYDVNANSAADDYAEFRTPLVPLDVDAAESVTLSADVWIRSTAAVGAQVVLSLFAAPNLETYETLLDLPGTIVDLVPDTWTRVSVNYAGTPGVDVTHARFLVQAGWLDEAGDLVEGDVLLYDHLGLYRESLPATWISPSGAHPLTSRKTVTLGQAVSSSQAGQLTSRKTVTVGQAAGSSAAQLVTARKTAVVGQAASGSVAQAVTWAVRRLIGQASAASAAQAVTSLKRVTLGQVTSSSTAQAVTARKTAALGQAASGSTAQIVTARKTVGLGQATSAAVAQAVTSAKRVLLGQASAGSTAQVVAPARRYPVGQASSSGTAQAVGSRKTRLVGQAEVLHLANSLGAIIYASVGQASSAGAAQTVTPVRRYMLAAATSAGLAGSVTTRKALSVAQAASGGLALAVSSAKRVLLGAATSAGLAQALTSAKRRLLGQASETGTAAGLGAVLYGTAGQASSSGVAQALTSAKRLVAGSASSGSAAESVSTRKTVTVGQVVEADQALQVAVLTELLVTLGQAVEIDLAQPVTVVISGAPAGGPPQGHTHARGPFGHTHDTASAGRTGASAPTGHTEGRLGGGRTGASPRR
jgi:hypothetical protein